MVLVKEDDTSFHFHLSGSTLCARAARQGALPPEPRLVELAKALFLIGLKSIAVTSLAHFIFEINSRSILLENEGDLKVKGA